MSMISESEVKKRHNRKKCCVVSEEEIEDILLENSEEHEGVNVKKASHVIAEYINNKSIED